MSEDPWASSEGSWTWLIARCWWPSWIQRAPQLVQVAIGYRPKPMVTTADRHSGQRGMGDLSGRLLVAVGGVHGRAAGAEPACYAPARLNRAACPHHCLPQGPPLDRGGPGCAWRW